MSFFLYAGNNTDDLAGTETSILDHGSTLRIMEQEKDEVLDGLEFP